MLELSRHLRYKYLNLKNCLKSLNPGTLCSDNLWPGKGDQRPCRICLGDYWPRENGSQTYFKHHPRGQTPRCYYRQDAVLTALSAINVRPQPSWLASYWGYLVQTSFTCCSFFLNKMYLRCITFSVFVLKRFFSIIFLNDWK